MGKEGSYYEQIDGVKYDKQLLDKRRDFVKDGQISVAEAKELFKDAEDGPGVTECECRTLQYTLDTMKYTKPAKEFMTAALAKVNEKRTYYEQIDGIKYDKKLLAKL